MSQPCLIIRRYIALRLTRYRIFIIEGLPTVVMGIATLWLLPNNPETVSFVSTYGSD